MMSWFDCSCCRFSFFAATVPHGPAACTACGAPERYITEVAKPGRWRIEHQPKAADLDIMWCAVQCDELHEREQLSAYAGTPQQALALIRTMPGYALQEESAWRDREIVRLTASETIMATALALAYDLLNRLADNNVIDDRKLIEIRRMLPARYSASFTAKGAQHGRSQERQGS